MAVNVNNKTKRSEEKTLCFLATYEADEKDDFFTSLFTLLLIHLVINI